MRTLWRGIVRTVFWSYERGTWPYDLLVIAVLVFIFASPRGWFRDQAQIGPTSHNSGVQLLQEDAGGRTLTYRVDSHLLAVPQRTPELEQKTHDLLRKNVEELKGRTFQIVRIEAVPGENGSVLYYDVSVKK